ncbi:MAG: hypothetical protein ACTTJZ_00240 [Sphaerochaetaceae bacterium]
MRIALVSCCLERGNLSFPLGALCIEAAISQDPVLFSNPTRHFSYLNDSDDPASAAREVLAWHPDAVGLSVYLWNRRWFDSFASCLAGSDSGQRLPADSAHPLIFAGGPEVTARMGCDADELYEIQDDFARLRKPFRSKRNYQLFQNDDGSIAFLEVS